MRVRGLLRVCETLAVNEQTGREHVGPKRDNVHRLFGETDQLITKRVTAAALCLVALIAGGVPANGSAKGPTAAQTRKKYSSCANLNVDYPNGVAISAEVQDRVAGNTPPVTTFVVDRNLYLALWAGSARASPGRPFGGQLDRDKDGIACERL